MTGGIPVNSTKYVAESWRLNHNSALYGMSGHFGLSHKEPGMCLASRRRGLKKNDIYIYVYIYIIHYIPIGQSQTRICPTWSSNISYISFAKSCIGQFADNCPI